MKRATRAKAPRLRSVLRVGLGGIGYICLSWIWDSVMVRRDCQGLLGEGEKDRQKKKSWEEARWVGWCARRQGFAIQSGYKTVEKGQQALWSLIVVSQQRLARLLQWLARLQEASCLCISLMGYSQGAGHDNSDLGSMRLQVRWYFESEGFRNSQYYWERISYWNFFPVQQRSSNNLPSTKKIVLKTLT